MLQLTPQEREAAIARLPPEVRLEAVTRLIPQLAPVEQAKYREMYLASLPASEQLRVETEMLQRMSPVVREAYLDPSRPYALFQEERLGLEVELLRGWPESKFRAYMSALQAKTH